MANQIIRASYLANNGQEFVVGINSEVLDKTNGASPPIRLIGYNGAPNADSYPLPRQMRPRRVVLFNSTGRRREIICLSQDAILYAVGQTILLEDSDGVETTYTVEQLKGEEFRKRRKQVAV